jgi:hypothetical protein
MPQQKFPAVLIAVSVVISFAASSVEAGSRSFGTTDLAIDKLKRAYLSCEIEALTGQMETNRIAMCSVIYEDLKARAFDGEFSKIRAWSDSQLGRLGSDQNADMSNIPIF